MKKVALLGVTGYIGKSLLNEFCAHPKKYSLFLFSRSVDGIAKHLQGVDLSKIQYAMCSLDDFDIYEYDVVINCTGIGDPGQLQKNPSAIFSVTESVDEMVISYLMKHKKCLYLAMSSGAVYGNAFTKPVTSATKVVLPSVATTPHDFYTISKIHTEAKHRALKDLNIVDLRVFAFFSRFVDGKAGFFMSQVVDCLQKKKVFKTSTHDMVRDYCVPSDLFALVQMVMKKKKVNNSFDVYSKRSITKKKLLAFLKKHYGLRYEYTSEQVIGKRATEKNAYCSLDKKAEEIGYTPKFTSLEGISSELSLFFKPK